MSDDAVKIDTKALDQLIKSLKGRLPVARVGVLGGKTARTSKESGVSTNAEIGAKHEFGNEGMPVRSFLRVPISDFMQKYLDKAGATNPEALKRLLQTGKLTEWVKKIGIVAEAIVADGFDSGGFGKWPPSDMRRKKNHQTLVETQQLRNSITSDVKE